MWSCLSRRKGKKEPYTFVGSAWSIQNMLFSCIGIIGSILIVQLVFKNTFNQLKLRPLLHEGRSIMSVVEMVHARKVAVLQDLRLEYGFRQYLKSYCYECIQDIDLPHTRLIDYKEYTFCSRKCAKKATRVHRQKRTPSMDDLCLNYS